MIERVQMEKKHVTREGNEGAGKPRRGDKHPKRFRLQEKRKHVGGESRVQALIKKWSAGALRNLVVMLHEKKKETAETPEIHYSGKQEREGFRTSSGHRIQDGKRNWTSPKTKTNFNSVVKAHRA